jgi:hypothetical protein
LDDYTYHSLVRPEIQQIIRNKNWNAFRLSAEQTPPVEQLCTEKLQPLAQQTVAGFFSTKTPTKLQLKELRFDLPWNRTFEAEIDFGLLFSKKHKP